MGHYNRPGTRYRVLSATRARNHTAPCVEDNVVGTAQKTQSPLASAGLGGSPNPQISIGVGEPFTIVCKGIVQVPFVTAAVKGSTVWINVTNDALTLADPGGGNGRKYGRVVEIAGQRATPVAMMRVDLDAKDSF